jgi:two-component system, OmpR family, KDP operon response regulator KdpE
LGTLFRSRVAKVSKEGTHKWCPYVRRMCVSAGRILVVDDEPQIRRVMRAALTTNGYEVSDARSGEEAVEKLGDEKFDLILLDVNLPGMSGLEACRAMRHETLGIEVPIIMLTVRNAEKDIVEALDAGADDYVVKPFGTPELLARIRAALRRAPLPQDSAPQRISLKDVEVDFVSRQVTVRGRSVRLTPKEFDLLRYLVMHPNKVIAHRELLQAIWGPDYGDEVEYLRVFVNQLRRKIEPQPAKPRYLLTEPWVGYRLNLPH